MTLRAHIIVPVKGIATGKSRLGDVMTDAEREALVERLIARTLDITTTIPGVSVAVVTPDPRVIEFARQRGAETVLQSGAGLNAGLNEAIGPGEPRRIIIVPADLPDLGGDDIEAHISADAIGISPDERRSGTNMLSLPYPDAIGFRFGPGSFSAHLSEAVQNDIPVSEIIRPGICFDLDTIDDLMRLKGWP